MEEDMVWSGKTATHRRRKRKKAANDGHLFDFSLECTSAALLETSIFIGSNGYATRTSNAHRSDIALKTAEPAGLAQAREKSCQGAQSILDRARETAGFEGFREGGERGAQCHARLRA